MRLFKLAVRNLTRNRRRTAITLVALVVGVGAMVTLRGFINGLQRMMLENIVHGQLGALQVHRAGYLANVLSSPLTLDMEDSGDLRARIRAVPGVRAVAGRIQFGAMVSTPDVGEAPGKTSFFLATALEPEAEKEVSPKRWEWVAQGQMPAAADARALVLGASFAEGLDIPLPQGEGKGEEEEQWPALLAADRDGILNGEAVVLAATLHNATPGDNRFGFVPLVTAQRLLRMEGRVTEYAVGIERMEDAAVVRDALASTLGPGYEVHTWSQLFPFLTELTGTQDFIFSVVSSIFLVVVLLGIVNAMLMSVLERVREIGTMLAVGLRRRQVVFLFLLEGLVLGAVGGALGVAVGFAAVQWMQAAGLHLPAPGAEIDSLIRPFVSSLYLARALTMAVAGSTLAALWPAYRASALRPVEALAHV
ncbi:MAG: ABC transporter permease [Myxococcota bacterium]